MKTIITITLLLCSIVAYGQNLKTEGLTSGSLRGTYTRDTTKHSEIFIPGKAFMSDYFNVKPAKTDYYVIATPTKTMIKVSIPDSTGLVKVWINKKEIYWLSDSIFIYKTEK